VTCVGYVIGESNDSLDRRTRANKARASIAAAREATREACAATDKRVQDGEGAEHLTKIIQNQPLMHLGRLSETACRGFRRLNRECGMSGAQIARLFSVSPSVVYRALRGDHAVRE
jgi:hypothetical protein